MVCIMISNLSWYDLLSATVSMERSNVFPDRLMDRWTNKWTDICDCRVAFATENEIWNGLFGTVKWASTGAQCSN